MSVMDFDLSKENIQPLRGGRNVQQLGMAIQAQTNRELQLELLQQKEEYENLIRTYDGDDPLENYYSYISWIEQSYPKHGHEGNFVPLLEHCLKTYENDKRYTNDRRFCKLWIKYFDLFQNQLELYHMMKAKGLCIGCADFYKAWAYYYEAMGDFTGANNVLEEGLKNLAQPREELENAHKNLIMAAGQHMLYGRDENRLREKRQALTSLHSYHSGRVPNVRVPNGEGLVTLPSNSVTGSSRATSNAQVFVYEDRGTESLVGAEAAPVSIFTAVKRQDVPKENTLKPGPWTTVPVKKRVVGKTGMGFTVHEDDSEDDVIEIKSFPKECLEDYSDWKVQIRYPEPPNPNMIPMYPKHKVYSDPNTEYSIEEIRAERYSESIRHQMAIEEQEILEGVELMQESLHELKNDIFQRSMTNQVQQNELLHHTLVHDQHTGSVNQSVQANNSSQQYSLQSTLQTHMHNQSVTQSLCGPVPKHDPLNASSSEIRNVSYNNESQGAAASNNFELWCSPQPAANFCIYEQSMQDIQEQIPPKGSAMKTAFKVLNSDELAETGSRGGMDIAVTAQATDSAKPGMPLFSDNSSSSFEDVNIQEPKNEEFNASCNTLMFNFDLNAMKVSTPYEKRTMVTQLTEEELGSSKKQLFMEPKALSTIWEETKSGYGSSSSSGATTKSSVFQNTNKMGTISEEHNSYLAQNLMANAELRSSLLGGFVDLGPAPATTPLMEEIQTSTIIDDIIVPSQTSPLGSPVRQIPAPVDVMPLNYAPSDPFKASFINTLLEKVAFPGPHIYGYIELNFNPRICLKKEPFIVGKDKYIVDKQLGKGTYGTVYKAVDLRRNKTVALKLQKPPNRWEFYICREIQSRLATHPLKDRFMDVSIGYFSDQASILISEFMPGGSLLDLANLHKQKTGKILKECLVVYFCIQMLQIVQALHKIKIIHADIKPDNFLVYILPDSTVGLQLIDFGCSIDMSLLPPNTTFTRRINTEDFVCCEMLDGRVWSYHTDLFCIAATTHVLLFDSYIKMKKQDGLWSVITRFPRYIKVDLWNMFFSSLLNQQTGPADSATLQLMLEEALASLNKDTSTSLPSQMRFVVNLLKNR